MGVRDWTAEEGRPNAKHFCNRLGIVYDHVRGGGLVQALIHFMTKVMRDNDGGDSPPVSL